MALHERCFYEAFISRHPPTSLLAAVFRCRGDVVQGVEASAEGADLGQHGLRSRVVVHVCRDRRLPVLVVEVLCQPSLQSGFEHVLRELIQQPARPDQVHALLRGLGEQLFGEVQ